MKISTTRRLLFSAFLFLSFFLEISGQGVPPELADKFLQTLIAQRNSLGVKSLSSAIQLSDGSVWTGAYGISSQVPKDSTSPEHAYAIGSITKTITSACVLQLADEGKLNLDDSLSRWLPSLPYVNPNITIRQLLRHQSGLFDVITSPEYDSATKARLDSVWVLENLIRDYMKPPLSAPGTNWYYCNSNYVLLGMIVEAVTGNPYYEEYKNRFFEPLLLNSISLPPFDLDPAEIAHLWIYNPANGSYVDAHDFYLNWDSFRSSAGPAGGFYAQAKDIAVWNRAFLRGDLHSAPIMAEAKTTVSAPGTPNSGRYGLGIMERKFLGYTAYGHGGDIGYSSFTYYFPQKDISITILNNDSKHYSWDLAPAIQALFKNYLDWESSVSTDNAWIDNTPLEIKVSPNPFVGQLEVSVDLPSKAETANVVLTDALGREHFRATLGGFLVGAHKIPLEGLADLPPGVYFLRLFLDGAFAGVAKVEK